MKKVFLSILLAFCMLLPIGLSACDPKTETPPDNTLSASKVEGVIAALTKQTMASITVEGEVEDVYVTEYEGEKETDTYRWEGEAKINVLDGNADFVGKCFVVYEEEGGENVITDEEINGYVRDWELFVANNQEKDESGEDLPVAERSYFLPFANGEGSDTLLEFLDNYILGETDSLGGIAKVLGENYQKYLGYAIELLGYNVPASNVPNEAVSALNFVNGFILSAADVAGAVERTGNKISIDLSKLIQTIVEDAESVMMSLNAKTTVKDFLLNKTVKRYMESLTCMLTTEKVSNKLLQIFNEIKADAEAAGSPLSSEILQKVTAILTTKPNSGSTGYEYLVKIATSQDFVSLMRSEGVGAVNYPAGDDKLFEAFGFDKKAVNAIIYQYRLEIEPYLTFDKNSVTIDDGCEYYYLADTRHANVNIEYTVDENERVRELALKGSVSREFGCDGGITETETATADVKIKFLDEKSTLADVDEYKVAVGIEKYFYNDGEADWGIEMKRLCKNCRSTYCKNDNYAACAGAGYKYYNTSQYSPDVIIKPVIQDGQIVDFKAYDAQGNILTSDYQLGSTYGKEYNILFVDVDGDGQISKDGGYLNEDDNIALFIWVSERTDAEQLSFVYGSYDDTRRDEGCVPTVNDRQPYTLYPDDVEYSYITIAEYLESKNQSAE